MAAPAHHQAFKMLNRDQLDSLLDQVDHAQPVECPGVDCIVVERSIADRLIRQAALVTA